ncbi:MAG: S1 RNA-binding domain-containing protein [Acidobacteriaceae bacterium]
MSDEELNQPSTPVEPSAESTAEPAPENGENFGELLAEFEQSHSHRKEQPEAGAARQLEGAVVSISADSVYLDIGFKTEGVLPRSAFPNNADEVSPGDRFSVSLKGRNEEGYYALSLARLAQVTDWASLEAAFEQKAAIVGTVTGVVKGGLSVDMGVRAFMPASRSGVPMGEDLEKLVGEEISCRIAKLDVADENVVVDRRVILEEQEREQAASRLAELKEGDVVEGEVRSLTNYGAFVNIGGVDGLLHVSDMAWTRVSRPEDLLAVGQKLKVKILKFDPESKRISLGLKQLGQEPWETVSNKYKVGQRVTGRVTRLADFGAFVELEPGIEGLIHVSEMSWVQKVRKPSDLLKVGDTVEAVILGLNLEDHKLSLGLKQALGDPWADAAERFPVGSVHAGTVTRLMNFGAFVQLAEGVEGLVHISEITSEKHLHHPQEILKAGEPVKVKVLALDLEKRQMKLSIKQAEPTSLDDFFAEQKVGDVVSGRVVSVSGETAAVELGEGVKATCTIAADKAAKAEGASEGKSDLASLTAMLQSRWKSGAAPAGQASAELQPGQVRSFRIVRLDAERAAIEVELQ